MPRLVRHNVSRKRQLMSRDIFYDDFGNGYARVNENAPSGKNPLEIKTQVDPPPKPKQSKPSNSVTVKLESSTTRPKPKAPAPKSSTTQVQASKASTGPMSVMGFKPTSKSKTSVPNRGLLHDNDIPQQINAALGLEALSNELAPSASTVIQYPCELQYELACARPGTWNIPYVSSNGEPLTSHKPGIAMGYLEVERSVSDQTTKPYLYFMLTASEYTCGKAYAKTVTTTTGDLSLGDFTSSGAGQAYTDVWGSVTNYADRYVHWANLARLTVRAAAANIAGVAYIARIQLNQVPATGSITFDEIRRIGIQVDFKETTTFEIRCTVNSRTLPMFAGNANNSDSEFVTIVAFPPGVATSISSGDAAPYTIAASVQGNYIWTPDWKTPGLIQITAGSDSVPVGMTTYYSKMIDILVRSNHGPIPMTQEQVVSVAAHIHAGVSINTKGRAQVQRRIMQRPVTQSMAKITNTDQLSSNEVKGINEMWSFTKTAGLEMLKTVGSSLLDWAKANALGMGKRFVVGAVAHLLMEPLPEPNSYSDQINWLLWCSSKDDKVLDYNTMPQDVKDLIDAYYDARENLVDLLKTYGNVFKEWTELRTKFRIDTTHRHEIRYYLDDTRVYPNEEYEKIKNKWLHPPEAFIQVRTSSVPSKIRA